MDIRINKKIKEKIQKETGLDETLSRLYDFFVESSNLTDGIVMFEEVKYKLREFIGYCGMNPEKIDIDKTYMRVFNELKNKKLLLSHTTSNGTTYPKIIGYNYYNDSEFYIATRKKGEKKWNGRIGNGPNLELSIIREINHGYEIREKEFLQKILN